MKKLKAGEEFTCYSCSGKFITEWDDEEAYKECEENFNLRPDKHHVGYERLCDDCYKEFMKQ